ncbi:MAG: hypothetical protein A2X45_01425 [Lentisphaerae bacterium GWF2_50_93]|nr:MAG: hypothetical protein A2X45_01425 [Lentisphaerae bacterium GWF2_50_93]
MVSIKKRFKFQLLKDELLTAFQGDIKRIPSERDLCAKYKASRTTVRKALADLEDGRLISREVGRGTFITAKKRCHLIWFICVGTAPQLQKYFEDEAERFMEEKEEADIRILHIESRELVETIRSRPGIKIIFAPNFGYLASTGMLLPLNELDGFTNCLSFLNSSYIEWNESRDGQRRCYSIPLFIDTEVFAWNGDLARKAGIGDAAPRDWNEIVKWLEKVRKLRNKGKDVYGGLLSATGKKANHAPPLSYYIAASAGKNFITNQAGNVVLDFSSGREWLDFFHRCHETGQLFIETEYSDVSPLFNGNILFAFRAGSWIMQQKRNFPEFPLRLSPIPPSKADTSPFSITSAVGMGIVNETGKSSDATITGWDFIRHLTCGRDSQRRLVENYFGIAINREVFTWQQAQRQYAPFMQSISTGTMRCDHPIQHGIMKIMRIYFDKALKGEISIDEAVSRINETGEIQAEIENDRSLV